MNFRFKGHQPWFNEIICDTIIEVKKSLPDVTVICSDGFLHTHKQILIMFDHDFRSALSTNPETTTLSINLTKAVMETALTMEHLSQNSTKTNTITNHKNVVKVETPAPDLEEFFMDQEEADIASNLPEEPISPPEDIPEQRTIVFDHPQQLQDAVTAEETSNEKEITTANVNVDIQNEVAHKVKDVKDNYLGCPTNGKCDKKFKKHPSKQMTTRVIELHLFKAHFDTCNEISMKSKDLFRRMKCVLCQKNYKRNDKTKKTYIIGSQAL